MSGPWIAALLVPALVAWGAIALLANARLARHLSDHPNERSLHVRPRARVGGIGVMAGALPVAAWASGAALASVLACAAALAIVSLLDDVRSLPIEIRLTAHLAAAAVALLAMGAPHWDVATAALAVLAIAWMTNLFNFMDGADGLAGGMAAIGFAALAIAAHLAGDTALALACAAIASASLGFLMHNFPPARVFLGDAGSIPLGFLAGALGIYGAAAAAWPPWFPLLVFSPFVVDATLTLARRLWRREAVWRAHRSHLYQRLVLAGWSHRRLALAAYALMAATAVSALAAHGSGPMLRCGIILGWTAAYPLLVIAIGRYLRHAGGGPGESPGRSIG
jgi:UDP-GlcNAc:undecaprenyl-phosphate GlcNAc-1-phosphate transferase